jgi:hypothetical protein
MAERKVTSIVWRQMAPNEIELIYSDGELEHIPGTHADAVQMAKVAGMKVLPTAVGTIRWVPQGIPKASKSKPNSE